MRFGVREMTAILRLILSLLSGGLFGFERSAKGIEAGFRTHIIVCMSACAIMLTNLHLFEIYHAGDLTRMPSQVISGVGFLGAGCILVTRRHRIKGVTTAAGLWASACLGLCIGAGDYVVAIFVLGAGYLALTVFRTVDKKLGKRTKYIRFYAELASTPALTAFLRNVQQQGIKVTDVEFADNRTGGSQGAIISLHLKKAGSPEDLLDSFRQIEGVVFISEL